MPQDKISQWLATFGLVCLVIFLAGAAFNVVGIFLWVLNSDLLDPKTNLPYASSEKLWLPALMLFPLAIQLYIFSRLLNYRKTLGEFVSVYGIVMCIGLSSYSAFWFLYTWYMGRDVGEWPDSWLTLGTGGTLAAISFLVWAVANCTRIITRSNLRKDHGLLTDSDLPDDQYRNLCTKLNALLNNIDVLENSDDDLQDILRRGSQSSEEYIKLRNILNAFCQENLERKSADEVLNFFNELKNWPISQIRPLVRVIKYLKEDADVEIYQALKAGDLRLASKTSLVDALNRIIMNPKFYHVESFPRTNSGTKIGKIYDTFDNAEKEDKQISTATTRILNRSLLDTHILQFLVDPKITTAKTYKAEGKKIVEKLLKLGCDDNRDRMIRKGIITFPFEMLTFFFTIFLCIGYLMGLSFAFHDIATIKQSRAKIPALYLAKEYPILRPTPSSTPLPTPTPPATGEASAAAPRPNPTTEPSCATSNQLPEFFFYYDKGNAGLREDPNPDAQKNVGAGDGTNQPQDAPSVDPFKKQQEENSQQFKELLTFIRDEVSKGRNAYVELIGRADDAPVRRPDAMVARPIYQQGSEGPQTTYASNYELSAARAENLKFKLLRQLRSDEVDRVKIEWYCLPASNDPSLRRGLPLDPSAAMDNNPLGDEGPTDKDGAKRQKDINEEIDKDIAKRQADIAHIEKVITDQLALSDKDKNALLELATMTKNLLDKKGKQLPQKSRDALFATFKCAVESRMQAEKNGKPDENMMGWHDYSKKLQRANFYFTSDGDGVNKRVVEAYVNTKGDTSDSMSLILMDYINFAMTGYGDIRPTTMYAKFLCTFADIVEIFFIVVFFNALLSVKGVKEHEAEG